MYRITFLQTMHWLKTCPTTHVLPLHMGTELLVGDAARRTPESTLRNRRWACIEYLVKHCAFMDAVFRERLRESNRCATYFDWTVKGAALPHVVHAYC